MTTNPPPVPSTFAVVIWGKEIEHLHKLFEATDGEETDETIEQELRIALAGDAGLESLCQFTRYLDAHKDAAEKELARQKRNVARIERTIARAKEQGLRIMENAGEKATNVGTFRVRRVKNNAAVVVNADVFKLEDLPEPLKRHTKPKPSKLELDKTAACKWLQSGREVRGLSIPDSYRFEVE